MNRIHDSIARLVTVTVVGCNGAIGVGSTPALPVSYDAEGGTTGLPDAAVASPWPIVASPPADDAGGGDAGTVFDAGNAPGMSAGEGRDGGNADCSGLLCDGFEQYPAGLLVSGTTMGPWNVSVNDAHGVVSVDRTRSFSGKNALKVHIDDGAGSGGQLLTKAAPLFQTGRTMLYGRFEMYIGSGADGTSQHWTMFGAEGTVPAGGAAAGDHATYLFSSFPLNNQNSFSAVYYDDQTAQDCYHASTQLMPLDRWACVAFSVDSVALQYRLSLDGATVPSMSVDTTGDGCGNAPPQTPWYGPVFDEFYIGALSFHPMSGALDLWIDDLVVDTAPVTCP